MLITNPEERISCHDALNDIWIKMQDKDEREDELLLLCLELLSKHST